MPRKCCVPNCDGNYDSTKQLVPVYRFPNEKTFPGERKRWIRAIPRANLEITKQTVVCRAHWFLKNF